MNLLAGFMDAIPAECAHDTMAAVKAVITPPFFSTSAIQPR
ncbi:hypothetical protein [Azospirillum tabaci]|nr:hypothetical protein [Azospirillum tabaci]